MRLASVLCVLIALAGVSTAQDTTFPVGPQYLITTNSTLFLRPIATPTLSLGAPLASTSPTTQALTEPSSTSAPLAAQPDLTRIYWGSRETEAAENVLEIEITSTQPLRPLPASIFDAGVTGMTDADSLRQRGYGATGETASFWKTHNPHTTHSFTNADVQRLHSN